MSRLLILDPSYATHTGHNCAVNSLLLHDASLSGVETCVFSHISLPAVSCVVPAFRTSAYGYRPQDHWDALQQAHVIGKTFAEDLSQHVQGRLGPNTVLLAHTLNNPLMHGIATWIAGLPSAERLKIRIGLNLPPDFRERRQDIALWNAYQYAFAFRLLTAVAPACRFYSETQELEAQFAALGAEPLVRRRLPLRVIEKDSTQMQSRCDGKLTYFVPGEIRTEKGHEFLIHSVMQIAAERPQWLERLRFRFTSIGIAPSLAVFLRQHPSLFELIPDTAIGVQRYWELMAEADVVGCTYDPADYRMRASGIFLEALAIGRPVVVSRGTSVAAEVAADGHAYGVTVDYGDVTSLSAGLEQLVTNYSSLRRGASAVAGRFRRELSTSSFYDWLFAE